MRSLHDEAAREEILSRLDRLSPESVALWGKMSASRAVAHLSDSFRMATGELAVASKKLPIRFAPLKQIIIYIAPFPKSMPTAPELVQRSPAEWRAEVDGFREAVAAFAAFDPPKGWPPHPAFGALSKRAWGVLSYRHADHHLRQFGA